MVRATKNEKAKAYIYQAKVNGKTMRIVVGKVSMWTIPDAQAEARRLQVSIDKGEDPRQVKADKLAAKAAAKLAKEAREAVTVNTAYLPMLLNAAPQSKTVSRNGANVTAQNTLNL